VDDGKTESGSVAKSFRGENGSKMCWAVSVSMPSPVSLTVRWTTGLAVEEGDISGSAFTRIAAV